MSKAIAIPGTYKRSLEGYDTFVPRSLPPNLSLPASIYRQVEDTAHLLGQVERSRTLLNADLLIYSSLQREALASSTIEGTIASPDDLVLFQVSRSSERGEAAREVANYSYALEWGVQEMEHRPLATGLILGLHERLMAGVRGGQSAGRFKEHQNHIGTSFNQDIKDAVFIPFKSSNIARIEDFAWTKMYHYFMFNRETFLEHYHKRSNVESVFSMVKGKFGDSVRSKSEMGR